MTPSPWSRCGSESSVIGMLPGSGVHHETQVVMYYLIRSCTILSMMTVVEDDNIRLLETNVLSSWRSCDHVGSPSVVRAICPDRRCEWIHFLDTISRNHPQMITVSTDTRLVVKGQAERRPDGALGNPICEFCRSCQLIETGQFHIHLTSF